METQRDYFQYGKIPEGEYNIKTKRFAELVRDIDRQVPLLKEEIIKLRGGIVSLKQSKSQDFEELIRDDKSSGLSWKNLFKGRKEPEKSDEPIKIVKKAESYKPNKITHKIAHKKIKKPEPKKSAKHPAKKPEKHHPKKQEFSKKKRR